MSIQLHIERLILDGISLSPHDRALLQTSMETELVRLLASRGLSDSLRSGGALYDAQAPGIQLGSKGDAARLGVQIAEALHGGIGK